MTFLVLAGLDWGFTPGGRGLGVAVKRGGVARGDLAWGVWVMTPRFSRRARMAASWEGSCVGREGMYYFSYLFVHKI